MAEEAKPTDLSALWGPPPEGRPQETPIRETKAAEKNQEESFKKEAIPVPSADIEIEEESLPKGEEAEHEKHEEKHEEKLEQKIIEKGFGQKLDELLAELNLTRKHLYGFVIGVAIILFIVFFGIRFITGFFEKRREEKPKIETRQEEVQEEQTKLDPSIRASFSLSREVLFPPYFFPQTGLELSLVLGETLSRKDLVTTSLIHLKRMKNAFSTDINQLLSKAFDRRAVLQNHLTLLRHLAEQANVVVTQLDSELVQLEPELKAFTEKRELTEQTFFNHVENLNPEASQELDDFIDQSKQFIEVRSRVRALTEIRNRYAKAIPRLLARITDVELNEDALVKGIAVYDVKGSDLQLIVPAEGEAVPEDSVSTKQPSVKPLQAPLDTITHPLLQEQKDFITKPGGGL